MTAETIRPLNPNKIARQISRAIISVSFVLVRLNSPRENIMSAGFPGSDFSAEDRLLGIKIICKIINLFHPIWIIDQE